MMCSSGNERPTFVAGEQNWQPRPQPRVISTTPNVERWRTTGISSTVGCSLLGISTMRRPFGTYLARPSGHDSLKNDTLLKKVLLYLCGTVAESICCQMLCLYSLASVDEAVSTIFGDPIGDCLLKKVLEESWDAFED